MFNRGSRSSVQRSLRLIPFVLFPALSMVVIIEINGLTENAVITIYTLVFNYVNMNCIKLLRLVFKTSYHLIMACFLLTLVLESSAPVNFFYLKPHILNLHVHRWSYTPTVTYINSFSYWLLTFQLSFKSEIKILSSLWTSLKYDSLCPTFSPFLLLSFLPSVTKW